MKYIILSILRKLSLLLFLVPAMGMASENYHKPSDQVLKQQLLPIQYYVTQQKGTETPFLNKYWNNEKPGIYIDIVSGEPLFSSTDKFDSKTGWPSFTKPLEPNNIVLKQDNSYYMVRTEAISKNAQSHLGHVFDDGPPPTHKRYCINSAALKFIPFEDLQKLGYGKYIHLFNTSVATSSKLNIALKKIF